MKLYGRVAVVTEDGRKYEVGHRYGERDYVAVDRATGEVVARAAWRMGYPNEDTERRAIDALQRYATGGGR